MTTATRVAELAHNAFGFPTEKRFIAETNTFVETELIMATRLSKLAISTSCASFAFLLLASGGAFAQSADSATAKPVVSSQKRSATTLHAQTAKSGEPDDYTDKATMSSDDVLTMSPDTANNLMAQAEQALSAGHINYALKIARKCVEEEPNDIDSRLVLARALAEKYRAQDDKQPFLLKECLEQYLFVARHGEHDSFQSNFAQQKMYDLTGIKWHPWLTQSAYLKKAVQGNGLVAGTLIDEGHAKAVPAPGH